jgi:hypothetical protein
MKVGSERAKYKTEDYPPRRERNAGLTWQGARRPGKWRAKSLCGISV